MLNKAYVFAMRRMASSSAPRAIPISPIRWKSPAILTDLKLDAPTIATALLHDTVEDTLGHLSTTSRKNSATRSPVWSTASPSSPSSKFFSERTKQAENFRKLMLAIPNDIRVLLVKLADRLHNMRTLWLHQESRTSAAASPRRRWISTRRWRGASACRICARSWKTWPSPSWTRRRASPSSTHLAQLDAQSARPGRAHRRPDQAQAGRGRHRGLGLWPRQAALLDLAQAARPRSSTSSSFPTFSASASSSARTEDCYRALGIIHTHLADGAGALQGFHLHAQAQRLSLDPHHGDRAGKPARGNPDPHPGRCTTSPSAASPPIGATAKHVPTKTIRRADSAPMVAARHGRSAGARRQRRGVLRAFQAQPSIRTRFSASRPRAC